MSISCKHGQLARSCDLCDNEKEILELTAINAELLEALKVMVSEFEGTIGMVHDEASALYKARRSIAKAEGKE